MTHLNDHEEQQAQTIACTRLVRGCEDAVSSLVPGEPGEQPAVTARANDILAQVLTSWRDALQVVAPAKEPGSAPAAANLDGWTSDELFAETLVRRADDAPALRLMQDMTLQALLTAHDHALATHV